MKKDDHRNENARRIMKQAGYACKPGTYARGGSVKHEDEAEDKKLIKKMVKKKDLKPEKKKDGGFVHGGMPKKRLDKISRQTAKGDAFTSMPFPTNKEKYAKGGKVKGHGKTQVNVIVGAGGQQKQAIPVPVPAAGAAMPPRPMVPPVAGPAPGIPGGTPVPPAAGIQRPMKRGGAVHMDAGAGGGKGRLEKIKEYGPSKSPKKEKLKYFYARLRTKKKKGGKYQSGVSRKPCTVLYPVGVLPGILMFQKDMIGFKERFQKKVLELHDTIAANFLKSRNADVHETGYMRGCFAALCDVLDMIQETEKEMNNE